MVYDFLAQNTFANALLIFLLQCLLKGTKKGQNVQI